MQALVIEGKGVFTFGSLLRLAASRHQFILPLLVDGRIKGRYFGY